MKFISAFFVTLQRNVSTNVTVTFWFNKNLTSRGIFCKIPSQAIFATFIRLSFSIVYTMLTSESTVMLIMATSHVVFIPMWEA